MSKTMNVVMLEPGKKARVENIDASLEGMQKVVGGNIEILYPFSDPVCLVCNEEGKIEGLPLNRALRDPDGDIYDIVAGKFFVCSCAGEDLEGLDIKQQHKYLNLYNSPEKFFKVGDRIESIKVPEVIERRR